MAASFLHPCLSCGACCAYFLVSFYWRETEGEEGGRVPAGLVEDVTPFKRCMKGTNTKRGCRCTALEGRVGERVTCSIYSLRPSPCRAFEASYEQGEKRPRCDMARASYGLLPLRRSDWPPGWAKGAPASPGPRESQSNFEFTRP